MVLLVYLVSTSGLEWKSPLCPSLGKEPFLSIFLTGLALRNVWLALLLGFLKTHLLTSFGTSYMSSFWVWFPLALPFLSPALPPHPPVLLLLPPRSFVPLRLFGWVACPAPESAHPIVCSCYTAQTSYFFTLLPFTWPQLRAPFHMDDDDRCFFKEFG